MGFGVIRWPFAEKESLCDGNAAPLNNSEHLLAIDLS
jgi:hypothetical protein